MAITKTVFITNTIMVVVMIPIQLISIRHSSVQSTKVKNILINIYVSVFAIIVIAVSIT